MDRSARDRFTSLADIEAACLDLPPGDSSAAHAVAQRQALLTKPPRSLGRLEDAVAWLARWQHKNPPRLDRVDILVFAADHGVAAQGISAYPPEVTRQMVENFAAGGAAINQLARIAGAHLRVKSFVVDGPTADFTMRAAMENEEFVAAVVAGYDMVSAECDLVCLGEMGIGNTTAAAAIAAALFGGGGKGWAGRGSGIGVSTLERKQAVIDRALAQHADALKQPLAIAAALGGRELAAILGAVLGARRKGVPVLLDGFVCTAAAAPLYKTNATALQHVFAAHVSAEAAHRVLLDKLELAPLLDLEMRLGEASGAAVAVLVLRAALACHLGMATFAQANVSDRPP
jgi:nicotinate-nucleotide--dimethylbenzimidazole phosphoribosyltransferase